MESHLLDGLLGRSGIFFGLFLFAYPVLEKTFCSSSRKKKFERVHDISIWSLVPTLIGLTLSLAAVVLSASEVHAENTSLFRFDFEILRQWTGPVLLQTQFGKNWLVFLFVFILAFGVRCKEVNHEIFFAWPVQTVFGGVLVVLFSRLGHGGALDPFSFWFGFHCLHLGAVFLWVGGLGVAAVSLFSEARVAKDSNDSLEELNFSKFGKFMRFNLMVILITGPLRSLLHWPVENQVLKQPYLWILGLKVVLVMGLSFLIYKLRKKRKFLRRDHAIDTLSVEILLAGGILFFSILLSQLPPP